MKASDLFGGEDIVRDLISRTVAQERKQLKISSEKLGQLVGLSSEDILNIEEGSKFPTRGKLLHVLAILGQSLEDILRMPARVTDDLRSAWLKKDGVKRSRVVASNDSATLPPPGEVPSDDDLFRYIRARALDEFCAAPAHDGGKAAQLFEEYHQKSRDQYRAILG